MFNKNSNKTLWIVFAVLLIAVILIFSTESTKQERSFRKDIVNLDTSAVSSFSIFPKSKPGTEIKFLRNNETWTVSDLSGKSYKVPDYKVKNIFAELLKIEPKRIAARSKSKWSEFQVDSAATRIVVNEDGSEVLNLIIGKFAFQQPRSMSTFVRIMNENDVYEVDGFLEMTFNKDLKSFRNENIVKSNNDKWTKLSFRSNSSESFELVKVDNKWMIDGVATDSSKTEKALNSLARVTSTDFIDDASKELLPPEDGKLVIEQEDGDKIEVTAYKSEAKYLIFSSMNNDSYFDGNKIGNKIFITKESLF